MVIAEQQPAANASSPLPAAKGGDGGKSNIASGQPRHPARQRREERRPARRRLGIGQYRCAVQHRSSLQSFPRDRPQDASCATCWSKRPGGVLSDRRAHLVWHAHGRPERSRPPSALVDRGPWPNWKNSADLILIDTGAGISPNVLSFTRAADEVLVVTTPEPTAITDAYAVVKVVCRMTAASASQSACWSIRCDPLRRQRAWFTIESPKVARQFLSVSVLRRRPLS